MAETPKIKLNDRSLGISPDEYAGGSYYYAEGIDTQHSTKGFRLGPFITQATINNRTDGDIVAISAVYDEDEYGTTRRPLLFTKDGYLETYVDWVGSPDSDFGDYGGAIYRSTSGTTIIDGIAFGDYIVQVYATGIHLITKGATGKFGVISDNIVKSPDFSDAGEWTVGANRTLSASGATHTAGSTAVLSQVIPTSNTKKYRVVIKHTKTAGSISVKFDAGTAYGFSGTDEYIVTLPITAAGDNQTLNIVPSSDYNGTIELIQVNEYTATIEEGKITGLTNTTKKTFLYSQGHLYIGANDKLEVIDIATRTLEDTLSLIDESQTIVSITEMGQYIVLWTTDGRDSKQYYRDRVSDAVSEVIERKGLAITAAKSDETVTYVVTGGTGNYPKVFIVDGYSRTLIVNNRYDGRNTGDEYEGYHPSKRFAFYVADNKCMAIYNKNLYIPTKGCVYTYGSDIAGMNPSRNNKIKYTSELNRPISAIEVINDIPYVGYKQTIDSVVFNSLGLVLDYLPTSTGYLVTNPIFWDDIGSEKALSKLRIGYRNVMSGQGNIKLYAIVDDNYFWTFTVTGITTDPVVGDTYKLGSSTAEVNMEVISTDLTDGAGTITLKTTSNLRASLYSILDTGTLIKLAGTGDTNISYTNYNNMVLIKTITSDYTKYDNDIIFSQDFIDAHIPSWFKIQFVVEFNNSLGGYGVFSEVFDLYVLSDVVNNQVG